MNNYQLLLNSTYLYLLQNPKIKINQVQIGKELGISRKTVAKELAELRELKVLDDTYVYNIFEIREFYNDEPNKYLKGLKILQDLGGLGESCEELSRKLGVSSRTLYPFYTLLRQDKYEPEIRSAVYAIIEKKTNQILYIGYTTDFEKRKKQHIANISNNQDSTKLYEYCTNNNIKDIEVKNIIESSDLIMLKQLEKNLIQLLQPIGNRQYLE